MLGPRYRSSDIGLRTSGLAARDSGLGVWDLEFGARNSLGSRPQRSTINHQPSTVSDRADTPGRVRRTRRTAHAYRAFDERAWANLCRRLECNGSLRLVLAPRQGAGHCGMRCPPGPAAQATSRRPSGPDACRRCGMVPQPERVLEGVRSLAGCAVTRPHTASPSVIFSVCIEESGLWIARAGRGPLKPHDPWDRIDRFRGPAAPAAAACSPGREARMAGR